jgi:hypothetical protein
MRRSRTDAGSAAARLTALVLAACGATPAAPVAPSCPAGAVVLASQADLARLARCTTLPGVTIRSGAALDTSVLRALATITGDLVIGPTVGVEQITLGELRVVGGAIHVVGNGLMQGLFLPRLERAGRIEIDGNVAITTISLPRLAAVGGAMQITDNASLELLDMPTLVSVDQALVLTGDPQLTLVEAAALQTTASVTLELPALPPDLADQLRATAAAR